MGNTQQNASKVLKPKISVEYKNEYDWQYVLSETGLTKSRISELMKYYSRLPLNIQLDVLKRQHDDFTRNEQKWRKAYNTHSTEARYVQLIQAINEQYKFEHQEKRKTESMNQDELKRLTSQRLQRLQQSKGKGNKKFVALKQRRFVMQQLRRQGASWRDIQLYLEKFHKIKISHSYIKRIYFVFFDDNNQEIA